MWNLHLASRFFPVLTYNHCCKPKKAAQHLKIAEVSEVPEYKWASITCLDHIHKPAHNDPLPREHHTLITVDWREIWLQVARRPKLIRKPWDFTSISCFFPCRIFGRTKIHAVRLINCKTDPFPNRKATLLVYNWFYEPAYQVRWVVIYTMGFLDTPKIYTVCGCAQNWDNLVK